MAGDPPFPRDRFDEMMVKIGTQVFDLQRMLALFTAEILSQADGQSAELDLDLAADLAGEFRIVHAEKIRFTADEEIRIALSGDESLVNWESLDLSSQRAVALKLHMRYTEEKIFRKLSSRDDLH